MGRMTPVADVEPRTHPLDAALVGFLRPRGVKGKGEAYDLDGYQLHAHPDLCDLLQSLNPACYRGLYGIPVLANDRHLLFGVAIGTAFLALRLPGPESAEAKAAGGFDFVEAGKPWVGVEPWSTDPETLKRWCHSAQMQANLIKE
jgi:hypothetical protein